MAAAEKKSKPASLLRRMKKDGFDQVVFSNDRSTGLHSIIAIHDIRLGPSLGGCRFYPYGTEEEALEDVLNLARAMTYKAALADLSLGGGKAVIIGDPKKEKNSTVLTAFGSFVDRLGGAYITTEDSGTSPQDMDVVRKTTRHVVGTSPKNGGSGDPSPSTALGVTEGIRACAQFVFGTTDLSKKKIALQGVGHVGLPLAKHLRNLGAVLVVADTNQDHLKTASSELGVEIVSPEEILAVDCDIFAPCALGGVLDDKTVAQLRCKIVAGAANNQLASPDISKKLHSLGITYAPDYAINAGGLIQVAQEIDGYDPEKVKKKTVRIFETITDILTVAKSEGIDTASVADRLAEKRLNAVKSVS